VGGMQKYSRGVSCRQRQFTEGINMGLRSAVAVCGLVCLLNACAAKTHPLVVGPMPLPDVREYAATLQRSVRRSDAAEYLPVSMGWANPTIHVDLSTTYILVRGGSDRRETTVLRLAKDLASLPPSAWSLGRVVVASRSGRTFPLIALTGMPTPSGETDPRVLDADRTAAAVLEILKLLNLEVVASPVN